MIPQLERLATQDNMGGPRSYWTHISIYKVYIRREYHVFHGTPSWWLDLANIAAPPLRQGKGKLAPFMDQFEESARALHLRGVHVECVQNTRFAAWLTRRKYIQDGMSFYKELHG